MQTQESTHVTFAQEPAHELGTYTKYPVALVRGRGCRVYDTEGREYLDFYAGHAVCSLGHCHPRVVEAVRKQAGELLFYSNICYSPPRGALSERLVKGAPEGIGKVFFCNSGSEANEAALKMARRYTGKTEIISFRGSFHGRTVGALAATGMPSYHQFQPELPGTVFATFGDLASVEALVTERTAGIIVEMIQSIGGIQVADPAFYQGLRALADRHGLVIIADEIQSGLARGGTTMWFSQKVGMRPDLLTTAKAIAGGLPMGATLVSEAIAATIRPNEHGTTFGGGPVAAAAALEVLTILEEDHLAERAEVLGERLRAELRAIPGVREVRGQGLLIGVALDRPAGPLVSKGWTQGLIVGGSGLPDTLRVIPPLNVTDADVEEFLVRFRELLA
jgi:acetylornithine/succinyldiaminopimelate/putrescine aminotransferase